MRDDLSQGINWIWFGKTVFWKMRQFVRFGWNFHEISWDLANYSSSSFCMCQTWHEDIMTWKCFLNYWPFMRGINWWLDSHHKGTVRSSFDVFLWCLPEQVVEQPSCCWFEMLWSSCDVTLIKFDISIFSLIFGVQCNEMLCFHNFLVFRDQCQQCKSQDFMDTTSCCHIPGTWTSEWDHLLCLFL